MKKRLRQTEQRMKNLGNGEVLIDYVKRLGKKTMTLLQIIFYAFAVTALFSGLMVVISRNAVRSALFLVLTFVASAGIWMLLNAEFLALILVLVYVGAVMTLFLFVVMMLSMQGVVNRETFVRYLPLGALILLLMVGLIVMAISPDRFGLAHILAPVPQSSDFNNIADLGSVLYTDYVFPFEVAGMLLLTAIIASISLTHRPSVNRKKQTISEQINVRPHDRFRLVKMRSEQKVSKQSINTGQ
jgi:NADH-quinone oxidoreductase subunit J